MTTLGFWIIIGVIVVGYLVLDYYLIAPNTPKCDKCGRRYW